jgi:hypothetical protein
VKQGVASLKCRCGREVEVNEPVVPGATYTCAYCNPVSWRRDRRRPRKEILFSELTYTSGDGDTLLGESAAEQIYANLDLGHITPGQSQANAPRDRERGAAYQNFLDDVISTDRPQFNKELREILDQDERWVLEVRATGFTRREYASRLKPAARIKFENAWHRMPPKMESVRAALKRAVRAQIVYE